MSIYKLARRVGVTQAAITKALGKEITEEELFKFLHGDMKSLYISLPPASGKQIWESSGKRYVHLEEVRFVARHFLRNNIRPKSQKALILSGTDPALACLPWAMSGIASSFEAYEKDILPYSTARLKLPSELRKIRELSPKGKNIELDILFGNCLDIENKQYGIIDLDFCSNQLRSPSLRSRILSLLNRVSPNSGPFVFRTTLHVGRANNTREDIERHIEAFEKDLRKQDQYWGWYKVRAHDRSPYQSSVPMISLVWILEKDKPLHLIKRKS